MKAVFKVAIAASLAAGAAAQPHNHQHRHQHARKHQQLAERDLAVEYAYTTETAYVDVADGSVIDNEEAVEGLADGVYKVVGESTPTTPPAPTSTSSSTTSAPPATSPAGGDFMELKIGAAPSSTSAAPSAPAPTASSSYSSSSSSSSGATGVDADFPDGELDCSTFPSDYGAVWLDNTGLGTGWVGYMEVGTDNYILGQTDLISVSIAEPTTGDVQPGYFVGYHCPAGYDAAQWPAAQGSTGQSVGGLWCGTDNKLHLTRSDQSTKLCQSGAGNVKVTNKLSEDVYMCKTWYPGNEGMYLPTYIPAGATVDIYNPYQDQSYEWQGSKTSAQYYINKKGVPVEQACTWTPDPPYTSSAGNWAPMNLGTSVNSDGQTFLSIFHNSPTTTATLDFNIEISGDDVSGTPCTYEPSGGSYGDENGCTVSTTGGMITVTFSE